MINLEHLRSQVPGLQHAVNAQPMVYFDWAATTQMPQCVIDRVNDAMQLRGNVRRGVHALGYQSTVQMEQARQRVAEFIGGDASEIIWTSGTTQALNLLANVAGVSLQTGDVVLTSIMEHHSHFLPWKRIALERGADVIEISMDVDGRISLTEIQQWLDTGRVRIIGCTLVSNVLGTRQPIEQIVEMSRLTDAKVVVDAAQAVAHMPIDVVDMGVDALVFGGHKIYGPTGVGVLWAQSDWMASWSPWMLGGGMANNVGPDSVTWMDGPHRFEAGTPNVSGIVGLVAALDWLESIGWTCIQEAERHLIVHLQRGFEQLPNTTLLCRHPNIPLFSFLIDGVHPHDLGTMCDLSGVMIRTGQHCTQPLHHRFGLDASSRVSLSFLNTTLECDRFFEVIRQVLKDFGVME